MSSAMDEMVPELQVIFTYSALLGGMQFVLKTFDVGSWMTTLFGFAAVVFYTGAVVEGFYMRNTDFLAYMYRSVTDMLTMMFSFGCLFTLLTLFAAETAGFLPDTIVVMIKDKQITRQMIIYMCMLFFSDVFFLSMGRLLLNLARSAAVLTGFPGPGGNPRPGFVNVSPNLSRRSARTRSRPFRR